ncbi:MAG: polysaccharide biosynthesis tyrosine autokinase [Bacteroidales bacterium]|nr:polysaccharide biosynthesis tyrosine autokinase [Bacteroidales bacterium]MCM1147019.1 polysaccharide biosynthesis tyrosine autokinase [Bacteroidales bacterium]MCM1205848.1 polysaccharide biosynthesis tyrosine autokinase [Bacillota bacterium]MCM1509911.1 polysaccharide biosynthesis tyrosine autokinase [Clostridium sp.]
MEQKLTARQRRILKQQDDDNSLSIVDIIGLCLSNWYWFVLCLVVTLVSAALYLRVTPPIFTRSTSIIVKDDANGRELDNVFSKYRTSRSQISTSLNNEMIALRKPALMAKVVERLHLDVNYEIRGHLRNTALYGSSLPVEVQFFNKEALDDLQFDMHIEGNGMVKVMYDDKGRERKLMVPLGKMTKMPFGYIIIKPTASFRLHTDDDITVIKISVGEATARFLSGLNVINTNDESSVIDLSLSDVNIERADDALNTLIAIYNEMWVENRNQIVVATKKFIDERLQAIELELGDVENEMTSYQVANRTLDYGEESAKYISRSAEYETEEVSIDNELTLTRYFRDYINKTTDYTQAVPLSAGINNPALAQQVNQYNALVLQRANLISASSEANPLVSDLDKQLSVLRHGILITVDNHIGTLKAQVNLLQKTTERNNARIDATPRKQKLYVDIERRLKIKEQLYTYLLQTREQNELTQAFAAYNTRILQPAGGSNQQSFPNVRNVLLIAFGIGLLFPFLFIVIREWMNSKVRGRKDIEKLSIPFIGELPHIDFADERKNSLWERMLNTVNLLWLWRDIKQMQRRNSHMNVREEHVNRVVVKPGSRNVINEAYRVLRTNVEFVIGKSTDTKVIMTTSMNPGSGKTFVSYNLALCMSLKKKRVVAVDLDLRRRNLSAYVNKPEVGISDYINGTVTDWHDILVKAEGSDWLYILPVGTLPPNPAEILAYDRFAELMEELRAEFDYVFLDCPPVEIVADTSIIAKYADMTLFVIRVGLMELEILHVVEEYYNDRKFNNLGIILNGTLTANSRYGYRRYGYRYGYGYGYGYGGYGYGSAYSDHYGNE